MPTRLEGSNTGQLTKSYQIAKANNLSETKMKIKVLDHP